MKYYNQMNLQQKLCRIRKKIPILAKRRYTETVDYDYTKIDDIYEFLTPAMDKYGVNFRIIEETPTQKDEHGEPTYLRQKDGMWIYEADAVLEWVNTDDPDDTETARIHLIGTHDMAEKAKGTAMTYGIKYYLFSRFNINQGGNAEDSDSMPSPGKKESLPEVRKLVKRREGKGGAAGEKAPETRTAKKADTMKEYPARPGADMAKPESGKKADVEAEARTMAEKKPESSHKDAAGPERMTKAASGRQEKKAEAFPEMNPPEESKMPDGSVKIRTSAKPEAEKTAAQAERDMAGKESPEDEQPPIRATFHDLKEDGFVDADPEEIPFDEMPEYEEEFDGEDVDMDELEKAFLQELEEEDSGPMTLEKARGIPCAFGPFSGKTFGELFDAGETGRGALEWVVKRYAGNNQEQKEAAAILLKELDRQDGGRKAA